MPYDKGDFTQQGINGDVSALVRLNDKRVVKMVLSSDDESSNVDVTGTVYDYLNGETYPLGGSTPTGTITITENGEGIDVAQYRYADVSVSGGISPLTILEEKSITSALPLVDLTTDITPFGFVPIKVTKNDTTTILYPKIDSTYCVMYEDPLEETAPISQEFDENGDYSCTIIGPGAIGTYTLEIETDGSNNALLYTDLGIQVILEDNGVYKMPTNADPSTMDMVNCTITDGYIVLNKRFAYCIASQV